MELLSPAVFILLFGRFQDNPFLFIKYSALFIFLIPIFFIDLYHRLILDKLTIPMAIAGLGLALLPANDISFLNALLTGVGILVLMLLIAWLFEKVRQKEGMGGGDIKLLAAMATWLGVMSLSFILFFASVFAVMVAFIIARRSEHGIPYGPFLVAATLLWILFGYHFLDWYLSIL